MTYARTLDALADPTRRQIVERLRQGPLPVAALAQGLPVSRPAVSQHLRVLSDAGLLTVTPQGTRRLYALAPQGVAALRHYLDTLWDDALAAFARAARDLAKKEPSPCLSRPSPRPLTSPFPPTVPFGSLPKGWAVGGRSVPIP